MNLGQTLITAIIKENKPGMLLGLQEEDFQETFERPMFLFAREYFSQYSKLPPITIVQQKFSLDSTHIEGDARFW